MPCACCWIVGNHNHFRERWWHSNFLEWKRFAQWRLSLLGWDFEMELWRTVVVQGEKHRRSLAIRREDTGHVSKLWVKTLFISENFHCFFRSFICIVSSYNILRSQDVVFGHFGKTGVYAGRPRRWTINNYSLKLKLKEQFVKFPSEIMPCACCWSVGNHNHFKESAALKFSWMETFCSMEVELTWMELWNGGWKDSCCSRRETAKLGEQDRRHWTCEQIVC